MTPTRTHFSPPPFMGNTNSNPDPFGIGEDSINGLVDSMLEEASQFNAEPLTPDSHTSAFNIGVDHDLMNGGSEDGVPHGRSHHAERVHSHHEDIIGKEPKPPGAFDLEDEPSFSSVSLSTPPKVHKELPKTPDQERISGSDYIHLPPDTETEDGLPLGRTHHAERAKAAHSRDDSFDPVVERDVQMLPHSPSSAKRPSGENGLSRQLPDPFMPKFDLGLDFDTTPFSFDLSTDKHQSEGQEICSVSKLL